MKRTTPKVEKHGDKITITLCERHADLLALFLGTCSPISFRDKINGYRMYQGGGYPELCADHIGPSEDGWYEQDTMVAGHIHHGLWEAMKWNERFPVGEESLD